MYGEKKEKHSVSFYFVHLIRHAAIIYVEVTVSETATDTWLIDPIIMQQEIPQLSYKSFRFRSCRKLVRTLKSELEEKKTVTAIKVEVSPADRRCFGVRKFHLRYGPEGIS